MAEAPSSNFQLKHPTPNPLERFIFLSRWLPAPLCMGLVLAQAVYVYRFLQVVLHRTLVLSALLLAWIDRISAGKHAQSHSPHP